MLFRGNREADIRRKLIRRGFIKGIIGLPANLFYGTGIPACILVIDKAAVGARRGVFMIDASRGFLKDGNKNRLRAPGHPSDRRRVQPADRAAALLRMVPVAEIAGPANGYNLNIPRYVDSSEPEDLLARFADLPLVDRWGVKGCSPTNLRKFRHFYWAYPEIQQTLSVESPEHTEIRQTPPVESLLTPADDGAIDPTYIGDRFTLGWSHYVTLLTIENAEARRFYEIEATDSGWSVRELERQIASSLYERLALSRDQAAVRRLPARGSWSSRRPT